MSWLGRRLDHLGSASFGAGGGLGLSQAPAFTQAYLQRLGGHIDEARLTISRLAEAEILPWLAPAERERAIAELSIRLSELERLEQTLTESPAMLRPLTLVRHADWSIAQRAAESFTPAVPIDPASLVWTGVGIVAAVVAYETCKLPMWALRRKRRKEPNKELNRETTSKPLPKSPRAGIASRKS